MTRRRRFVRILVWLAAVLGGLVLLAVLTLAFLIGTPTGTRLLFSRLGALLPGTFSVKSTEGRIDSPLTLHGMVYKRPGMEIRIDRLYLEWRLRELLARRVDVRRLYADGVHVVSTPSPNPQPTQLPDLDLHFNVIVRDARVRGLTLGSGGMAAAEAGPAAPVAGATAAAGAAAAAAAAASGTATPTTSAATAAPTVIDEIDLSTTDIGNLVRLDRLAVRSAVMRADITGTVQPRGDYPVDLAMRWEVHPPGPPATAPVVGSGTMKGSLATLRVDQTLTAPFDVRVAAVLFQPLRDVRFDGRVAWNGVNPHRLRADLPDLQASGQAAARGSLDRFDSWGAVAGAMAPAGSFHLDYRVSRQGDAWQVQQADLTLPGTPSRVALRGRVLLPATAASGAGNLDLDLQASWRDAAWPPRGKASFASPRGEAHVAVHAGGAHPAGQAAAAAAGAPAGSLSSEGTVQAVVTSLGPIAASYRLTRQGADWRLEKLDLAVPGTATHLAASGRVAQRGQTFDVDAGIDWRDLAWPLTGPPSVRSRQGQAKIAGSLDSFRAQISADLAAGPGAAAPAGAAASAGGAGAGTGSSAAAAKAAPTAANPAVVPSAAQPATAAARAAAAAPAGTGAGTAGPAAAAAAARTAAAPAATAGRFTLSGTGNRERFHVDSLAADVLSGHLQGRGDIAWSPRLSWNLALSGQGIDPAAVRPDLPGRLGFQLATRGESQPAGLTGSVDLPQLQGTLRGQPVAVTAAMRLAGPSYDLSRLDARWGTARLRASGRLGERFDLGFDAAAPNLGLVVPAATGSLTAQGHVAGAAKTPRVQASAHAQGLRYGTQSVGDATLHADVDLAAAGPFQLDADLHEVSAGGQLISRLTVQTRGTSASHTLALSAVGLGDQKNARFDVGLAGGVSGPLGAGSTWRGQISRLDLRSSPVGDWSLQGSAALQAGASAVQLRDLCWVAVGGAPPGATSARGGATRTAGATGAASTAGAAGAGAAPGGARLCASAAWSQAGPWAGEATLASLPLNLMKPLLPPDLTISGEVSGKAEAHGGSRGIAGADVDLAPGPGDLRFPAEQGRTVAVHFERGSLRARAGPAGGDAAASLAFTNVGTFEAQVRLPRLTQGIVLRDQPLAGTIAAHLRDLTVLEGFVPDLRRVGGTFNADLRLAGTAGAPRLTGQALLEGGSAQVPLYGLNLKNIRLAATASGGTTLAIDAGASSGPGSVRITGSSGLMPSAAAPVHLAISGSRFEVMGTRDIRILVSPDMQVDYQGTVARVTGQVTVPEAHVHVEKAPKGGPIEPSKDVVFVGGLGPQAQQPAKTPIAMYTRLRLVLPNPSVELDALGLKGQPYGSLLLVENPGNSVATGTGELDIAAGGTFQAYGQNLTIQRGRLIFGGPIDDPGLDIRASRLSDDSTVTAGIDAKGTLKQPLFSVWSTPTMGQSDALAYLLLGHGLSQANAQEGNRVANAATSLGLAGAGLLAKSIGARFGLEEASIESKGNLNQASLVLGKYLAPHLYVIYGIGLFQPVSTFRIRY
ncbi:MAG TPA: translocation/assembly module TamB domain-containing protein, partial [Thermoanaerobaculia bacterium]|nr:translocation/assembly module TamB domain-containing protein [Thermoanaerobaculia bacterium]